MKTIINLIIVIMLTALSITGCSSSPAPYNDPYNPADSQRDRSKQAQHEMSTETSRER